MSKMSNTKSNAEIIFERIKEEKLNAIKKFVEDKVPESEWLEFKCKEEASNGKPSKNDKANFSKSLSGFLNGSGGVLIWGIKAQKGNDNPDVAIELSPINQLKLFLTELQNFMPDAVCPYPQGIEFFPIEEDDDKGYLVIFIPQSDFPPHQVVFRDKNIQNHYFRRTGDSTRIMSHFELEDLFGRRPKPVPVLIGRLYWEGRKSGGGEETVKYNVFVEIGIKNQGRGIFKFPALILTSPTGHHIDKYGLNGNKNHGLPLKKEQTEEEENTFYFIGTANDVIPPDYKLFITRYKFIISTEAHSRKVVNPQIIPDFKVIAEISGEGILPRKFICQVKREEFIQFIESGERTREINCLPLEKE